MGVNQTLRNWIDRGVIVPRGRNNIGPTT